MATTLLVPGLDGGGDGHWLSWFEAAIPDTRRVVSPISRAWICRNGRRRCAGTSTACDEPVWIIAHGFGCLAAVRAAFDFADRIEGALLVAPFDPDNLRLAVAAARGAARLPERHRRQHQRSAHALEQGGVLGRLLERRVHQRRSRRRARSGVGLRPVARRSRHPRRSAPFACRAPAPDRRQRAVAPVARHLTASKLEFASLHFSLSRASSEAR